MCIIGEKRFLFLLAFDCSQKAVRVFGCSLRKSTYSVTFDPNSRRVRTQYQTTRPVSVATLLLQFHWFRRGAAAALGVLLFFFLFFSLCTFFPFWTPNILRLLHLSQNTPFPCSFFPCETFFLSLSPHTSSSFYFVSPIGCPVCGIFFGSVHTAPRFGVSFSSQPSLPLSSLSQKNSFATEKAL